MNEWIIFLQASWDPNPPPKGFTLSFSTGLLHCQGLRIYTMRPAEKLETCQRHLISQWNTTCLGKVTFDFSTVFLNLSNLVGCAHPNQTDLNVLCSSLQKSFNKSGLGPWRSAQHQWILNLHRSSGSSSSLCLQPLLELIVSPQCSDFLQASAWSQAQPAPWLLLLLLVL